MMPIQQLTDDSKQSNTLVLEDGSQITLIIEFKDQQLGWFITELTYGDFTVQGIRIVTSPNMLYQFKNKLPFGLACIVVGNIEPTQQADFITGSAKLYILTASEVDVFSEFLKDG